MTQSLTQQIESLLAQTQCTECGFDGCAPYAEAIAASEADINLCRPGGQRVIDDLAKLLNKPSMAPSQPKEPDTKAKVVEADCIGCTKCIQACPTGAIIGAPKMMHQIIAADCTGCKLCLPVCPVDCIELLQTGVNRTPRQERERAGEVKVLVDAKKERAANRKKYARKIENDDAKAESVALRPTGEDLQKQLPQDVLDKISAARQRARQKYTR